MGVKLFGFEHILFIVFAFAVLFTLIIVERKVLKTEKQKTILVKSVAAILLIAVIINRISIAIRYNNILNFFPETYCGLSSFLVSICVLFGKRDAKLLHFVGYMGLVGGVIVVFYPNFLGQADSIFYLPTISGLIHHALIFILVVLLLLTNWFVPDRKKWYIFPIGLGSYTLIGLFEIQVMGFSDAMQINTPLISGTILNWWFVLCAGTIALYVVLLIAEKIRDKRNKTQINLN